MHSLVIRCPSGLVRQTDSLFPLGCQYQYSLSGKRLAPLQKWCLPNSELVCGLSYRSFNNKPSVEQTLGKSELAKTSCLKPLIRNPLVSCGLRYCEVPPLFVEYDLTLSLCRLYCRAHSSEGGTESKIAIRNLFYRRTVKGNSKRNFCKGQHS